MRTYVNIAFCILFLLCAFQPVKIYAENTDGNNLPKIVKWENGNGFDAKGTMLKDCWAYDMVNSAGRYVLFSEAGSVLEKAETWNDRGSVNENFTPTEQETATIALRVEPFSGFNGKIIVTLTEKSGLQNRYTLNQKNLYVLNVSVNSGDYRIQAVEAYDDHYVYETIFSPEQRHIQEKGLLLLQIEVTDHIEGEVGDVLKTEEQLDVPDGEGQSQVENIEESGGQEESMIFETGLKKYMFVLGGFAIVGLAFYLLFRSKRNKYN